MQVSRKVQPEICIWKLYMTKNNRKIHICQDNYDFSQEENKCPQSGLEQIQKNVTIVKKNKKLYTYTQ